METCCISKRRQQLFKLIEESKIVKFNLSGDIRVVKNRNNENIDRISFLIIDVRDDLESILEKPVSERNYIIFEFDSEKDKYIYDIFMKFSNRMCSGYF